MTPDAYDLCVFAVKRGAIKGRFDVNNLKYAQSSNFDRIHMVSLGSLTIEEPCYGTSSTAVSRTSEKQPKYIRITDFDDYGIEEDHEFMTVGSYSEKHLLKPKDILFARTGGTVGKTYFYDGTIGEAVFAGYCIRFRFDENKVDPKYVYWYTKTDIYQKWVKGIQRPSGQPNINKEEYKTFKISLPGKTTQENLRKFLDNAFKKRTEKLRQAKELLGNIGQYIHSVLGMEEKNKDKPVIYAINSICVINRRIDPEFHNPFYTHRIAEIKKLEHDTLGNIIEFSTESWDQKSIFETFFPYIEISGVKLKENTYETTDVPVKEAPSRAKMIVRNGDIIVSTTRPHRGAITTIVCPDDQIQIASTGFCVLRNLKRNDVLKEYLQWILLDDYVLLQMLQRSSGGNYPAISSDELKKVLIPIPDVNIQRQIYQEAKKRKLRAYALRQEAEQEWQLARAQFEKELLES